MTWSCSNTNVATVDPKIGLVAATQNVLRKSTTVIITATANDGIKKKATFKVMIYPILVDKVKVNGSTTEVRSGNTLKLAEGYEPRTFLEGRNMEEHQHR